MSLIIKLRDDKFDRDWWLEWSTICDAPLTYGMSRDEMLAYLISKCGDHRAVHERLDRVSLSQYGTSSYIGDNGVATNRAGPNDRHLSVDELLDRYCRSRVGKGEMP